MSDRLLIILVAAAALNACGVKSALEIPNGQPPMDESAQDANDNGIDPSLPPQPLGQ